MSESLSIVIPSKNEEKGLAVLLPELRAQYPAAEIIVVDDGSVDDTVGVCKENQVKVVSHPYSMGNGAAVKTGARVANNDILIFLDGDGQHDVNDIPKLLSELDKGFDMVVGARHGSTHANIGRWMKF